MLGLIVSLVLAQTPTGVTSPAATVPAPSSAPVATAPATNAAPVAVGTVKASTPATTGTVPAASQPATPPPGLLQQFLPLLPMVLLGYFILLRPQQQQAKKLKEMLNKMQRNDKVITTGGIYGTVVSVDTATDTVTLRLGSDPGVKVDFSKASILRVVVPAEKKD